MPRIPTPMTIPTAAQQNLRANSVSAPNPSAQGTASLPQALPAMSPQAPGQVRGTAQSQLALGRPQGQTQGIPLPVGAQQSPQTIAGIQGLPNPVQIPALAQAIQQLSDARAAQQPGVARAILSTMTQPQVQPQPSLGQLIGSVGAPPSPDGLVRRQ